MGIRPHPFIHILSMKADTELSKYGAVTEIIWSGKSEIFTVCPFTAKFHGSCSREKAGITGEFISFISRNTVLICLLTNV